MSKKIVCVFGFIISILLVIKGNSVNGYNGLIIMFIGLTGLLIELYSYNRKYQ